MAAVEFVEFDSLEALEIFCKSKSLRTRKRNGFAVIADVLDEKNILWGYVSNNSSNYKCKNPNTKYVLVWE